MIKYREFFINHAINEIRTTYGVNVVIKNKSLLKFGKNDNVGTSKVTIMYPEQDETYVSTNVIDTISSSDAGDTEEIKIEGHTVDGNGDFTFVVQTKTLTGQTKAVLDTPLARVSRMYNNGTNDLVGDIYCYEDDTVTAGVPQTASKIHIQIPAANQQSFKTATTFSSVDYGIITGFYADIRKKQNAGVDFFVEIRQKGKIFRESFERSLDSSGTSSTYFPIDPYLIVPANADIRIRALSDTAGTSVDAGFEALIATVAQ